MWLPQRFLKSVFANVIFFLNIRRRPGHVVKMIVPTRASKSIINALRLYGTIDLMYALILGLIYFELTVQRVTVR